MRFTSVNLQANTTENQRKTQTNRVGGQISICSSIWIKPLAAMPALFFAGYCLAATPYQQSGKADDIVAIEAEGFTNKIAQGNHDWSAIFPDGQSGTGALEAAPNAGTSITTTYESDSPRLDYRINFITAGTYYIWIRAIGTTSNDDSLHVGLDGKASPNSTNMGNFSPTLNWNNSLRSGGVAIVDVAEAGEHTLNLWMREDGVIIDKLVMTTNSSYTPSGTGPATSLQQLPAEIDTSLPIDLRGAAPEQATIERQLSKPADAQTATLTLSTFDADRPDEGQLIINGNTPIALFGEYGISANDDQNVSISIATPADYWNDGNNTLEFQHIRTAGFTIDEINVTFDGSATGGGSGTEPPDESITNGGQVQINFNGNAPQQQTASLQLSKPQTADTALITLDAFDADNVNEGELVINNNPPIPLFGAAASNANGSKSAKVTFETPASYWSTGENTLVFKHNRTAGYSIDYISVEFPNASTGNPANNPPILNGTPATNATIGSSYLFQPTASDVDGDDLVYSIVNQPAWAGFDIANGTLSGTPENGDLGTHSEIQIAVSDGKSAASLPTFNIVVADDGSASGGGSGASSSSAVVLNWSLPTSRENGSSLSPADIMGHTLYYGPSLGHYPDSMYIPGGNQTSATLRNRQPGETIYMVLTSWDKDGLESQHSNVAVVTVNSTEAPTTPGDCTDCIKSISLVNTNTNTDISQIVNGYNYPEANQQLAIRVDAEGASKVDISLNGPVSSQRTEGVAPYSSFGDSGGSYIGKALPAGTYTISATAKDASGGIIETVSLGFTLAAL